MRGFSRGLTAFCLLVGAYARVGALGALVHTPGRVRGGISIDWCIIRQTNILEVARRKKKWQFEEKAPGANNEKLIDLLVDSSGNALNQDIVATI